MKLAKRIRSFMAWWTADRILVLQATGVGIAALLMLIAMAAMAIAAILGPGNA